MRKLVEQDKVFAMVGSLGDSAHPGTWDCLNEKGVPDILTSIGSHMFGTDADGACDLGDVCTDDPNNDADSDGICVGSGYLPPKTGDNDNCPETPNPDQTNTDVIVNPPGDALGDACDPDDDNDTVMDGDDADLLDPYVCRDLDSDSCDDCSVLGQPDVSDDGTDTDADGACNAGDPDDDNDTVLDGDDADLLDPYVCRDLDSDSCDDCSVLGQPDVSQDGTDTDSDGACDAGDPDDDNDTVMDGDDADPLDPYVCRDLDSDTCDDCSVLGVADPSNDGTDTDSDGLCDAGDSDDDNDGFDDPVEVYLSTDPLAACPLVVGSHDAWPLDANMDRAITVVGDILNFAGRIGATPDSPEWWQRLDLDMDNFITVVGDALMYTGMIGENCT